MSKSCFCFIFRIAQRRLTAERVLYFAPRDINNRVLERSPIAILLFNKKNSKCRKEKLKAEGCNREERTNLIRDFKQTSSLGVFIVSQRSTYAAQTE
jgi:hypothetical protein